MQKGMDTDQGVYLHQRTRGLYMYKRLLSKYVIATYVSSSLSAYLGTFSAVLDTIPYQSIRIRGVDLDLGPTMEDTFELWRRAIRSRFLSDLVHRSKKRDEEAAQGKVRTIEQRTG